MLSQALLYLLGGAFLFFTIAVMIPIATYSKTVLSGHSKHIQRNFFRTYGSLTKVDNVAECSLCMRGSRNFCQGGPGLMARKQPEQRCFVCLFLFFNLFYSLQRGSNRFITEKSIICQGSNNFHGVQHLKGGQTFSRGGPNANFYRNPYNL